MGKKVAAAHSGGKGSRRSRKGMAGFSLLAIMGLSIALFPPASLFALCLIPWVCALLASRRMGHGLALSVLWMSFAGTLPAVILLAQHDASNWSATLAALTKPYPWVCTFGAAALAWFIHGFVPFLVASVAVQHYQSRRVSMHKCLDDMKKEWGPDVETSQKEEND